MLRVLAYVIIVVIIGGFFAWLANHPGTLIITLGATRYTLSIMHAAIAVLLLVAVLVILWWLLKTILSSPATVSRFWKKRRYEKGYEALSQGLLALEAGDNAKALQMQKLSASYLDGEKEPLVYLLEAQTSLLHNDQKNAIRVYKRLEEKPETRLLALHGLYMMAEQEDAFEAAGQYALKANALAPNVQWALRAALDHLASDGKWVEALAMLDHYEKTAPKAQRKQNDYKHLRVIILTAQAQEIFEYHPQDARQAALKAVKLEPGFVPANAVAAQILYKLDETRKASKLLERLWLKNPHPDIARIYVERKGGMSAVQKLENARHLVQLRDDCPTALQALAREALNAGELAEARQNIEKSIELAPLESSYLLLADIEMAQSGNEGYVRQWLARAVTAERDDVWIGDGMIVPEWMALSPIKGHLGGVVWRKPPHAVLPMVENIPLTLEPQKDRPTAFVASGSQISSKPQKQDVENNLAGQSAEKIAKTVSPSPKETHVVVDVPQDKPVIAKTQNNHSPLAEAVIVDVPNKAGIEKQAQQSSVHERANKKSENNSLVQEDVPVPDQAAQDLLDHPIVVDSPGERRPKPQQKKGYRLF